MFIAKQINLVTNGKGVGKRFCAANFVRYLNDRGIPYPAIKSDSQRREIDWIFIAHGDQGFAGYRRPRILDRPGHRLL